MRKLVTKNIKEETKNLWKDYSIYSSSAQSLLNDMLSTILVAGSKGDDSGWFTSLFQRSRAKDVIAAKLNETLVHAYALGEKKRDEFWEHVRKNYKVGKNSVLTYDHAKSELWEDRA